MASQATHNLMERMGTEATAEDAEALQSYADFHDVDLSTLTPDQFIDAMNAFCAQRGND